MTVVIDTNVWISALHFASRQGTPTQAIQKAITADVIATCTPIEDEISRILTTKFLWHPNRVKEVMDTLLARAIHIQLTGSVQICRDPNDDMFLECALLSGAEVIVAGDKDLLILDPFHFTRILTPAQYLAL